MVIRFDSGTFQAVRRTPQGGLEIDGFPTRIGVFPYRMPDGSTRLEFRPPDEVFQERSLATLGVAPVTDLHPDQSVTADNWKALAAGHIANVHQDGDHVAATLLIQDRGLVDKVLAGDRKELSCGYSCDLDPTPGIWERTGERYDAIQRGITYNHLAVGPKDWGRAGPTVALRLDSAIQVQREQAVKETINGIEYTVGTPEWAQAVRAQAKEAQARADAADAKFQAADGKVKALEVTVAANTPAKFQAAVQRRASLVLDCGLVAQAMGVEFKADEAGAAPEASLISAAITTLDPTFKVEGKTPEALAAVFEYMVGQLKATMAAEPAEGAETTDVNRSVQETGPGADQPPAPVQPGQPRKMGGQTKTDALGTIFGARRGVQDTRTDAAQKEDAARCDSDKAREDMLDHNRKRGTSPLAYTKKPAGT